MTRFLRRWLWRIPLFFIGLALIYQAWIFGHVVYWNFYNPSTSAFMRDRLDVLRQKDPGAALRMQWMPYERISPHLKRAIIAAEDSKFLEHEGFDFEAIQKAYEKNLKKGRLVAGGSTISQQLAKNLFLSDQKTPLRKIQEALITLMLENVMSKRRIMEIYLNVIEWGNGVFGAEAAIRHYYGASASSISAEQAARLAAMIPNPRFYDRHRNTPWLSKKTGIILSRMPSVEIP
ncbi:MAG: monofunctional biosynthetic peptidoglycan transglycosylase [Betaproteobacteria bacterium]|nr:monofunctional biosynthetic peptidoglycan transglycosylase [Betaproteobacteria bacterium]